MALTGRTTLILAVLLALAMPSLVLFAWSRVGRSSSRAAKIRRWTVRGGLVLGAQLSAVILAGVLVNDAGNFYTSWLELLGEKHTVRNVVAVPGSQDAVLRAKLARARAQGRGLVTQISIPGTSPRFGTFSALVYLPAQYGLPEYAHRVFPVVELIAGSPGTPKTWTESLHVAQILDREIAAGRSSPFIAVMPSQDVAGRRDTQCVNVVHGPNVEMYLTLDVRNVITRAFRASTQSREWALMGYSSGGFCATNLAMRHPESFSAAVSIAGNGHPAHDSQTGELFGKDPALRDLNTPIWRASPPPAPERCATPHDERKRRVDVPRRRPACRRCARSALGLAVDLAPRWAQLRGLACRGTHRVRVGVRPSHSTTRATADHRQHQAGTRGDPLLTSAPGRCPL